MIRLHFLVKMAGGLAWFWGIVWALHFVVYQEDLTPGNYVWVSLLVPAAALVEILGREERLRFLGGLSKSQLWSITQREILYTLVAVFGAIVMCKDGTLSRLFLGTFVSVYAAWTSWMNLVGYRLMHRSLYTRSRNRKGENGSRSNMVVLASPGEIERDSALHMTAAVPGAEVVGYVTYGGGGAAALDPVFPVLGDFPNLAEICRSCRARLLLALGLDGRPDMVRSLQQLCDSLGMRLIWVDDKEPHFGGKLDSRREGGRLLLTSWQEPLEDPMNRVMKRTVDLLVSTLVCVTVLPALCVFVKILQIVHSPGPMLYRQKRTGRDGEVFDVYKFRTMHLNDDPGRQATVGDPRIYRGGGFLRRTSLDEMPQFLNVLSGHMSVIGPRPHFVDHDARFAEYVADYPVRQFAKPGITGLAQVKGCRGETDTPRKVRQRVRLDRFYLRNWSPLMDLCILCETA
ncbi:MAG TPA: sugar transferase, partial [Bacteroidia bacterium]|nr:sugar transferase [Bacteroidia bacterium]